MNKSTYRNIDYGFTLVELLLTVAILGIIASLAISNFSVYRDTAYQAELLALTRSAITSGQAGLVDGRFGIYNNEGSDPQLGYEIKFPGLKLPDYIQFDGAMHNLGDGSSSSPSFYFRMFNCRLSEYKNRYGFSFGSSSFNYTVPSGLNKIFSINPGICY